MMDNVSKNIMQYARIMPISRVIDKTALDD